MAFESSVRDSDLPILFIYYKYLFLRGGLGRLAAVISSSFIMILTSTAALADAPIGRDNAGARELDSDSEILPVTILMDIKVPRQRGI